MWEGQVWGGKGKRGQSKEPDGARPNVPGAIRYTTRYELYPDAWNIHHSCRTNMDTNHNHATEIYHRQPGHLRNIVLNGSGDACFSGTPPVFRATQRNIHSLLNDLCNKLNTKLQYIPATLVYLM